MASMTEAAFALAQALTAELPSDRLQAALTAGTHPDESYLDPLIERCAIESDFYVRDMLTWSLTRLPHEIVLPRVVDEASSHIAQARSQALHTLSKLGDPRGFDVITGEHLHDADDEVARASWRTAAGLVPYNQREDLVRELVLELGRGDLDVMRSLSRALVELGDAALQPLAAATLGDGDSFGASDGVNEGESKSAREAAAMHARATLRLIEDPEATFVLE